MDAHLTEEDKKKIEWIKNRSETFLFVDEDKELRCLFFIESRCHLMDEDTRRLCMSFYRRVVQSSSFRIAKHEMNLGLDKGTHCPLCNRFIKRYKRKMNSGMSRSLIWLYEEHNDTGKRWIDVGECAPTFVRRSNEISRLSLWGLVKEKPLSGDDKKSSGMYRITNDGEDFVRGKTEVPSHVFLVNNVVEGFSEGTISIRESLGDKFSYSELMGFID